MNIDKAALRAELAELQGDVCGRPSCDEPWIRDGDMAHVYGSGMGGRPSTYRLTNLIGLCRVDHDRFDGRTMQGRQDFMRELMAFYLDSWRRVTPGM